MGISSTLGTRLESQASPGRGRPGSLPGGAGALMFARSLAALAVCALAACMQEAVDERYENLKLVAALIQLRDHSFAILLANHFHDRC